MRFRRQFHAHAVTGPDDSSCDYHAHNSGLADDVAHSVTRDHSGEQPLVEVLDLTARVPQAGHADDGTLTEVQECPGGQTEQVDARRRHIFAKAARFDAEAA